MKAILSSRSLHNFCDLLNLRNLVHHWCSVTHTFFLSCGELTVTLEDVANQLLLPILDEVVPLEIQLSDGEMAVEAELRKGLGGGNVKLSNWIRAFIEVSVGVHYVAFIMFWLCKFIFGAQPHYVVKPLYF